MLWRDTNYFLDGTPKLSAWKTPNVYCLYPLIRKGDFFGGYVGGLIASAETAKKVLAFFEMAGELLPLNYEGERCSLLNVTECINALDQERTTWHTDLNGQKLLIKKYAFHANRFTESSLFKIPETRRAEVLAVERCGHPDEEFKAFVEQVGLTGLRFEELWADSSFLDDHAA